MSTHDRPANLPDSVNWSPGQIGIVYDGRAFAIEPAGKRWTKVPEYLTNGQLTARFFVDESTGEVRAARSWKSPQSSPLGGDEAAYVRAILEAARNDPPPFDFPAWQAAQDRASALWRAVRAIRHIRAHDCDFLTVENVLSYAHLDAGRADVALEALRAEMGDEWLARMSSP